MGKEFNILGMEISIKENILMGYQMVMDNILGLINPITKEILNKELDLEQESGKKIKLIIVNLTLETMLTTIKMDMEFTHGLMDANTKENFKRIKRMDTVKCTKIKF